MYIFPWWRTEDPTPPTPPTPPADPPEPPHEPTLEELKAENEKLKRDKELSDKVHEETLRIIAQLGLSSEVQKQKDEEAKKKAEAEKEKAEQEWLKNQIKLKI